MKMENEQDLKYIARNRKARHDYQIMDTFEAGIELLGTEVKSLRDGKVNIADSYALIENGQLWLKNLHISQYKMASVDNHEPMRTRRLLMHKKEIRKLISKTEQKGLTLIPLSIYFRKKLVKIELALAVGRKKYDKRQTIAKSEADRKISSAMKKEI